MLGRKKETENTTPEPSSGKKRVTLNSNSQGAESQNQRESPRPSTQKEKRKKKKNFPWHKKTNKRKLAKKREGARKKVIGQARLQKGRGRT